MPGALGKFPHRSCWLEHTWHGLGSPFHRIKIYVSDQPDLSLGLRPVASPASDVPTFSGVPVSYQDVLAKLPHPLACCGHLPPHPGRGLSLLGPGTVPHFLGTAPPAPPVPPRVLIPGAREGNSSNLRLRGPRHHLLCSDEAAGAQRQGAPCLRSHSKAVQGGPCDLLLVASPALSFSTSPPTTRIQLL